MKQGTIFRGLVIAFVSAAVLLLLVSVGVGAAGNSNYLQDSNPAKAETEAALASATEWLVSIHQNEDGGFTSFSIGANSGPSDIGGSVDALLALASAGADIEAPLSYLGDNIEQTVQYAEIDGSTAGKLILSLAAAGVDPSDFMGHDFVISLTSHLSPTGEYGVNTAFNQSLAILALVEAGDGVPDIATDWLLELQENAGDLAGSWSDGFGTDGNSDSTALALMALTNSDDQAAVEAVSRAKDYLARSQLPSGGWEYGAGFGENANSTALVLQALGAIGEDVDSPESPWVQSGITPLEALLSWQADSGAFQADFGEGRFDDFFSTVQSVPAMASLLRSEELIFAPALAGDTSSEEEAPTETAPTIEAEKQIEDSAPATQDENVDESEEEDDGFSLCPSAFALMFLAGIVLVVPGRWRR
jgi:hypothetical protein